MKIHLKANLLKTLKNCIISICWLLFFVFSIYALNMPCPYDEETFQFRGTPLEQAKCLLRPIKSRGNIDEALIELPQPLAKIIGAKVKISQEKLRKYLQSHNLGEMMVGGNIDDSLSQIKLPSGEEIQALYFIIHDTSTPNYGKSIFPTDINEKTWKYNNLDIWLNNPVAHIFVNRLGESMTTTPFSETVRKGWGTKFARDFLKDDGKGLQLHIELCQPRRSNINWFEGNDEIAPEIGFTQPQYERLALLYICASVRRGSWLIPAFHAVIDAGIKDAHDDPQNFELVLFAKSLQTLTKQIQ